jgi:hypothetical protein
MNLGVAWGQTGAKAPVCFLSGQRISYSGTPKLMEDLKASGKSILECSICNHSAPGFVLFSRIPAEKIFNRAGHNLTLQNEITICYQRRYF